MGTSSRAALRSIGAALAVVIAGSQAALAQSSSPPAPPFDAAIDIQTFEYAVGPKTFVTVADGDVGARRQLAMDALVTVLTRPLEIYDVDDGMLSGTRTTVVRSMAAAQLTASYGLTDRLQLGANLPIVFAMQGDGLMPETGTAAPGGLSVTGLGDLVLEGKYRVLRLGALRASAIGAVSLPTSVGSGGSQFIGDDLPSVRGKLAAQLDRGRFALGVNAGILLRKPRTIYDSTVGNQVLWGAAAALRITERFSLIAEGHGRAGLPSFAMDASPLEVEGGMRIYATSEVAVLLGGGAGLVKGIGSPEARLFVSLGYAPDVRDSDGDGVPNGRDRCKAEREDRDGHADDDGCPDDDNDGDHRLDAADRCVDRAEDLDGFEDDDGCPELDNDRDTIADLEDKCPMDREDGNAPFPLDGCPIGKRESDGDGIPDATDTCPRDDEDLDGFEDADGCADPDNDRDGVPDDRDRCPVCPEDRDSFEDDDGCPELDNDRDGVPDAQDRCPREAETANGVSDGDGCRDTGGVEVVTLDDDRLVIDRIPTLDGAQLSRGGEIIVDQLALVMRRHADVTRWLIAIALPSERHARQLGDAVRARLVAQGVAADRVEVLTAAGSAKIGGVARERAPEDAAPVCPAGVEVAPRRELSKPPAAAPAP